MQQLIQLYNSYVGGEPKDVAMINAAGSNRQYVRFTDKDGHSLIGVIGTSCEENDAFVYLSEHFRSKGIRVPEVFAVSRDRLRYLQEDFGTRSLFDAIRNGRELGGIYDEEEKELLLKTIKELPKIQVAGAEGLDFSRCYPQQEMDGTNVSFDLNYFKYCFLKPSGIDFHELRLEEAFREFSHQLSDSSATTFLYRDFQARNVMLLGDNTPAFIDFQGGRRGPLEYDVASFAWQASACYSDALRQELVDTYIAALRNYADVDEGMFRKRLRLFVLFRNLQVLGAYGYRGYFERKQHFINSIAPALANLRKLLEDGNELNIPSYLREVLALLADSKKEECKSDKQIPEPAPAALKDAGKVETTARKEAPRLHVRIFSFSFKRGIPEDESGNGGGYVFDCRSTHNPGRYEPYKNLTGLDEPVIRFLEDDGEIITFLKSVYRLADSHVERYIQRGFTDLMFSFGCTGGQHRSVYSAQHLAEHLHAKYGIRITLIHREQKITQTFLPE
ncbi:MAG: phosphotransferase [Bacteroidaceae bacterium]|nr:phosphotransferase [Bacteroidaceae bacterium]